MTFQTIRTMRVAYGTIINNILRRIPPPALPEFTAVKSLCDNFLKYFVDKIETTRSKCSDEVQYIPSVQKNEIKSKMKVFKRATEDEIEKLSWVHRQHRVIWTPVLQAC